MFTWLAGRRFAWQTGAKFDILIRLLEVKNADKSIIRLPWQDLSLW